MRKIFFLAVTLVAASVSSADAQWRSHHGHRGGHYGGGFGFYRPAPIYIAPPIYQRRVYIDEGYCEIQRRRVATRHGYRIRRVKVCF
jgi:hypothetical protein